MKQFFSSQQRNILLLVALLGVPSIKSVAPYYVETEFILSSVEGKDRLTEVEVDQLINNPDETYINCDRRRSKIAEVMSRASQFDRDPSSPVHALNEHLQHGYNIAEKMEVIQALAHAENIVESSAHIMPNMEQMQLDMMSISEALVAQELDIDIQSVVDAVYGVGRSADLPTRACCNSSNVTFKDDIIKIREKLYVLDRAKFFKNVEFKDEVLFEDNVVIEGLLSATDVSISGTLSVTDVITETLSTCDVIVGCDLFLNDSINPAVGNVIKNGNHFIHTYPGTASHNTFVGENAGNFTMTGVFNSGFGFSTLRNLTTGTSNTAIGDSAMLLNTEGNLNIAVGDSALFGNTTGSFNIAVGAAAMAFNTTGIANTAVGYIAMLNNTTGIANTAVGNSAMSNNTTGDRNTCIGQASMLSNTSGRLNTGCGDSALRFNITGSNNTAVGQSALRNNLADDNTAVGQNAMANNTTGFENTAVGQVAMNANTIGVRNTAVGRGAMINNTIGSENTAIGTFAMASNTTGSENTALGEVAMNANTIGVRNTAVGRGAMINNTTGSVNTAIGTFAMASNTTGSDNTAVGEVAMNANTIGVRNTAIGRAAMLNNTIGIENTAVGQVAMQNNTTGIRNTAVGRGAMFNNTIGNDNTAVGTLALVGNTTGINNTAVGLSALGAIATGANNIAVGAAAGASLTGSDSDNIDIGNPGVAGDNGIIRIGTTGLHTSNFQAGIFGAGPIVGAAVLVNAAGQLGTVPSSERFKHNIADMGDESANIMDLRPVTFAYNGDASEVVQYGLIAEEVDQVFPALVVKNADGQAETVQYHILPVLLLNEVQKYQARFVSIEQRLADLEASILR